MSSKGDALALACPESIQWVEEAGCVIVVDEHGGEPHILRGAEAAVWGWLTLGYPFPKLARLLAALLALPLGDAEHRLATMVQHWHAAGLLAVKETAHG